VARVLLVETVLVIRLEMAVQGPHPQLLGHQ
jgi:hypothetical protein